MCTSAKKNSRGSSTARADSSMQWGIAISIANVWIRSSSEQQCNVPDATSGSRIMKMCIASFILSIQRVEGGANTENDYNRDYGDKENAFGQSTVMNVHLVAS